MFSFKVGFQFPAFGASILQGCGSCTWETEFVSYGEKADWFQLKLYDLNITILDRSQEALVNIAILFSTSARTAKVIQVLSVLMNNKALNKARILLGHHCPCKTRQSG